MLKKYAAIILGLLLIGAGYWYQFNGKTDTNVDIMKLEKATPISVAEDLE